MWPEDPGSSNPGEVAQNEHPTTLAIHAGTLLGQKRTDVVRAAP